MKRTRDLSKAEFERAMKQHGWVKEYFGYWKYCSTGVHPTIFLDGKPHYRQKLAGMIQEKKQIDQDIKECESWQR